MINADDFGLTPGISRGILRAHGEGVVTSVSVLAVGDAFAETAPWLERHPALGVGVHLALAGGHSPCRPAREVPSLVDGRGALPASWRAFLRRWLRGAVRLDEVRRELGAQIDRVLSLGVAPTHLDSHQHLHLLPGLAAVVLELAADHRIPAIRVPRSSGARPLGHAVNWLARRLAARARRAGIWFPADGAGFDEAGRLDRTRLAAALDRLARGGAPCAELVVHPGETDAPARRRYRWGYRWDDELALLTAPATREAIRARGFTLATYRALGDAP